VNVRTLIGNLATDVELKDGGAKKVASFLLACRRASKESRPTSSGSRPGNGSRDVREFDEGKRVAVDGRLKTGRGEGGGSGATQSRSSQPRPVPLPAPGELARCAFAATG